VTGAHDHGGSSVASARLQLLAKNGFEITGRMFCAKAVYEGYLKRRTLSLPEQLFLVNLIMVYVRDRDGINIGGIYLV
jgi:hypothetical protein